MDDMQRWIKEDVCFAIKEKVLKKGEGGREIER